MADQARADGIAWLRALLSGSEAQEILVGRRVTMRGEADGPEAEDAAAPAGPAPSAPS